MSPQIEGRPIEIVFAPSLRAHRGKLNFERGREVHAASFLRQRRIVLDAALRRQPAELARILIHELFHFAWIRLGNPKRRSFEVLLQREIGVRGELGWSSERLKAELGRRDTALRTRRWREYACESFCDTAAWVLSRERRHEEFTLAAPSRRARRAWFERTLLQARILV